MPTPPRTVSDLFPREHLIAADLPRPFNLKISHTELREFTVNNVKEMKLVLHFVGAKRFLILNKTNALKLIEITGSEQFTEWHGKEISLTPGTYRGKPTIIVGRALVHPDAPAHLAAIRAQPAPDPDACPTCEGKKEVARPQGSGLIFVTCPTCEGTGKA